MLNAEGGVREGNTGCFPPPVPKLIAMRVRVAQPGDVPRMMELEGETEMAAHWTEQNYTSIFSETSPKRIAFVVEGQLAGVESSQQGGICGFIVARCFEDEWEIENVVVALAERRKGLGSSLVDALLERARVEGASSVALEVRRTNLGAKQLYEKHGFRQCGTRKGYYSNPLDDALVLRLDFPAAASENG